MSKKKDTVSVSKIANELEEQSFLQSKEGKADTSSRTFERNFKQLMTVLDIGDEVKDEKGQYAFEESRKAVLAAVLLETARKDSYLKKVMQEKEKQTTMEDVLLFFQRMATYTQGKMDERERIQFLAELDKNTHFSMMAILTNMNSTILALIKNIQEYPYEHQVMILEELYEEVIVKFQKNIEKEIQEFLKKKQGFEDLMDSIEDPENTGK